MLGVGSLGGQADRPVDTPSPPGLSRARMTLKVNGEGREVPEGLTLTGLFTLLGLDAPRLAVEVNRTLVPRALHAALRLADGDQVEIVTFVGGG